MKNDWREKAFSVTMNLVLHLWAILYLRFLGFLNDFCNWIKFYHFCLKIKAMKIIFMLKIFFVYISQDEQKSFRRKINFISYLALIENKVNLKRLRAWLNLFLIIFHPYFHPHHRHHHCFMSNFSSPLPSISIFNVISFS